MSGKIVQLKEEGIKSQINERSIGPTQYAGPMLYV